MATTQTGSMTWEQFRALPDSDEYRHTELIDGVLVHKFAQRVLGATNVNPPSRDHQRIVFRLAAAIDAWAHEAPGRGEATVDPAVQISADHAYVPDVAWYPQDRCPPPGEQFQGPPALVVEVLSPSTRKLDERRKRLQYARVGVDEMWLIDPAGVFVQVHRRPSPDADTFHFTLAHGEERELTSPLLPGFSLRLDVLVQP